MNDTEIVKRDGKVALRQIGTNQRPVPISVNGNVYQASIQHNIWLLWVEEEIASQIIESPNNKHKQCDCGGGAYKPLFKYANPLDVSLYDTGDRPR